MLWPLLGLAAAFSQALSSAYKRKSLKITTASGVGHFHAGSLILLAVQFGVAAAIMAAFLLWRGLPSVAPSFWATLLVVVAFEILGQACQIAAQSMEELSVTGPFFAANPVFIVLVGWWALGERVTLLGGLGVATVVAGSVWFSLQPGIRRPKPWALVLLVMMALSYSITPVFMKQAIVQSSQFFFGGVELGIVAVFTAAAAIIWSAADRRQRAVAQETLKNRGLLLGLGLTSTSEYASQAYGVVMAPTVAYFWALKRLVPLFSLPLGRWMLGEQDAFRRLWPVVVMVLGAIIVMIAR